MSRYNYDEQKNRYSSKTHIQTSKSFYVRIDDFSIVVWIQIGMIRSIRVDHTKFLQVPIKNNYLLVIMNR
jgi:hypothetical protein